MLLSEILISMFEVEDFVRLMVGEAIRGESTTRSVGFDLFTTFQSSIEEWIAGTAPISTSASALPRWPPLSAMIVGVFVEYAAGVLEEGQDLMALAQQRAHEAAAVLGPPK